jgi:ribonuclease HII
MTLLAGVDDAGRGPVIGPMVIAAVIIDETDEPLLKQLGAKDSKLLTPKQRENLFEKIKSSVKSYHIEIIPPSEIDKAVDSENSSLNELETINFAKCINALNPEKVIVDCPSINIPAFSSHLKSFLKSEPELHCEHKADLNHPVVSAASILAKVTRDREIEKIQANIKENIGSGYPADPFTKEFIKNNWNKYPEIFRHSWETYRKISGEQLKFKGKSKSQKSLTEF